MPKTRGRRHHYAEQDSSSDEEGNSLFMLSTLLGGLHSQSRRRKSEGKSKKKPSHSSACSCNKTINKKSASTSKSKIGGRPVKVDKTAVASKHPSMTVSIETDDEETVQISKTQESHIKNKVDTFFKALESDDDEPKVISKQMSTPEKKSKDFYTLSSDDEGKAKMKKPKLSDTSSSPSVKPGPSENVLISGLKFVANAVNVINEKKTEDLFAYVDEVLNECNEVLDLTEDKPKENESVLTLEDLKKKTEEILHGVASYIDDLTPKPQEPEKKAPSSPVNEVPSCPVCLEPLGGSRQAMATLCGHMFCEACLLKVIKVTRKCPSCRKGLTKKKCHPVYL